MPSKKRLTLASSVLIGSVVCVALATIALPKRDRPREPELPAPEATPKTSRRREPKVAPAAALSQTRAEMAAPAADPVAALQDALTKTDADASPTREQLVAKLIAIGPKALPMIVDMVTGAAPDGVALDGAAEAAVDPELLELRERALHDAIARFDPAQRLACIVERGASATFDERLVLVGLLGDVDHPDAVGALIELIAPIEPIQWQREYVRGPVSRALAQRFRAHPEALEGLRSRLKDEPPELLAVIADACTLKPTAASIDLALALLDRSSRLDLDVLRSLARTEDAERLALDEVRLERMRRKLTDADAEIRRAAAAVVGALHEFDSVDELVALLADPEPGVSTAAHWSLRLLVRLDHGDELPAWNAWLTERATWHSDTAPALLEVLAADDAGEITKALGMLLSEPQNRRELVDAITPLLTREDPAVFSAACSALGSLGSARALPDLVSAMASKDQSRRDVAAATLRTLTGLDLPAKPAPWAKALGR